MHPVGEVGSIIVPDIVFPGHTLFFDVCLVLISTATSAISLKYI